MDENLSWGPDIRQF